MNRKVIGVVCACAVALLWFAALFFEATSGGYLTAATVVGSIVLALYVVSETTEGWTKPICGTLGGLLRGWVFRPLAMLALFHELTFIIAMQIIFLEVLSSLGLAWVNDDALRFLFRRGFFMRSLVPSLVVMSTTAMGVVYFQSVSGILVGILCGMVMFIYVLVLDPKYFSSVWAKQLIMIPSIINREDVIGCSVYRNGKRVKVVERKSDDSGFYLHYQQEGGTPNHWHLVAYGNSYTIIGQAALLGVLNKSSVTMLLTITAEAGKKLNKSLLSDCQVCENSKKWGLKTPENKSASNIMSSVA